MELGLCTSWPSFSFVFLKNCTKFHFRTFCKDSFRENGVTYSPYLNTLEVITMNQIVIKFRVPEQINRILCHRWFRLHLYETKGRHNYQMTYQITFVFTFNYLHTRFEFIIKLTIFIGNKNCEHKVVLYMTSRQTKCQMLEFKMGPLFIWLRIHSKRI